MSKSDIDIVGMSNRLRAGTAQLLGLDETKLQPAEKIRVDRASALRLLLDDWQSNQLRGGEINVGEFVKASEELERLVGGDPQQPSTQPDFVGASEQLAALLNHRAGVRDARMSAVLAELSDITINMTDFGTVRSALDQLLCSAPSSEVRSKFIALLCEAGAAINDTAGAKPTPVDSESPKEEPAPIPAAKPDNVVPLQPQGKKPPAHYLKGPPEPWESGLGAVCAPYFGVDPVTGKAK